MVFVLFPFRKIKGKQVQFSLVSLKAIQPRMPVKKTMCAFFLKHVTENIKKSCLSGFFYKVFYLK